MSLVIDSSVTLSWCFEDERTDVTATLLYRVAETGALVPALWRLEVANGLQVAVRRGRIDVAYRDATIADLRGLAIDVDPETDRKAWSEILQLADRFRLTLYDAPTWNWRSVANCPWRRWITNCAPPARCWAFRCWACERTGGSTWPVVGLGGVLKNERL